VGALREILIQIIKRVHLAVLLFVLLGWTLPWKAALLAHIITIPLVVLQWRFNNGTCLLTNLENFVRGGAPPKSTQQGQFIKSLLKFFCDPLPPDHKIKIGLYAVIWSAWSVSVLRWLLLS